MKGIEMDPATMVIFIFVTAMVVMIVAIPLTMMIVTIGTMKKITHRMFKRTSRK
jgi:hypothetical protein